MSVPSDNSGVGDSGVGDSGAGDIGASGAPGRDPEEPAGLVAFYDRALPTVYGYLSTRCETRSVAEDLTAETFLAAVDAVRRDRRPPLSMPWIIGVARHKLVDHWRKQARQERNLQIVEDTGELREDPWDARLEALRARETLERLGPHHRAALTFRYLDDLSVPEVADLLQRSLHATEALLVRARAAFRREYEEKEATDA